MEGVCREPRGRYSSTLTKGGMETSLPSRLHLHACHGRQAACTTQGEANTCKLQAFLQSRGKFGWLGVHMHKQKNSGVCVYQRGHIKHQSSIRQLSRGDNCVASGYRRAKHGEAPGQKGQPESGSPCVGVHSLLFEGLRIIAARAGTGESVGRASAAHLQCMLLRIMHWKGRPCGKEGGVRGAMG